jgi:hypothetical protein
MINLVPGELPLDNEPPKAVASDLVSLLLLRRKPPQNLNEFQETKHYVKKLPKYRVWIEEEQEFAYLITPNLWDQLKKQLYYKAIKQWPDVTPSDPGYLACRIKYYITRLGHFYKTNTTTIGNLPD